MSVEDVFLVEPMTPRTPALTSSSTGPTSSGVGHRARTRSFNVDRSGSAGARPPGQSGSSSSPAIAQRQTLAATGQQQLQQQAAPEVEVAESQDVDDNDENDGNDDPDDTIELDQDAGDEANLEAGDGDDQHSDMDLDLLAESDSDSEGENDGSAAATTGRDVGNVSSVVGEGLFSDDDSAGGGGGGDSSHGEEDDDESDDGGAETDEHDAASEVDLGFSDEHLERRTGALASGLASHHAASNADRASLAPLSMQWAIRWDLEELPSLSLGRALFDLFPDPTPSLGA
jgi:hypothetical protein